ncbi:uncharacterized protein SCHCODRAFT_02290794 [Schizophyllum commune H4-8]|uniref:uncharacterized protein n=1 Tax=Schizophyllum commune (strain H4-8 / FGSC 9210) TaxID=578458 RepID=UPI00215F164A|nr:uncharacterized protein SCHCODRAFT_02290794 [Schizophyllum commune H4-8]KAI5892386.1 hypothetical protein SCHCODRAFT_02290794 [Schizophyllum commune H4-8]
MPAEGNLPSLTQQESRRAFDNDEDLDAPFMTVDPWRGRWGRRLNDATVDVEAGPSASQILAQAPFGRYKPDAVPRVPQVVPEDVSLSPSSTELDLEVDVRRRKLRSRGRTESIIQPAAGPYHDAAGYGTPVPPSAHVPYGLDDGSPSPFRPPSDTILWPPSTYTPSIRLPPNHLPSARTSPPPSPSPGLLFTRPPSPEPPSTRPPSIRSSTLSHGPHGRTLSSLDKAESEHSPRSLTSLDFQWMGPFHSRPESVVEPGGASMRIPAPIPKAPPAPITPPPIHISVNANDSAELHSPPRPFTAIVSRFAAFTTFIWQVVPTTLYLCALFRLPALYFSRVARVFENADLCRRDIIRMAVARATQWEKALGGRDAYGGTRDHARGGIHKDASGGFRDYAYGYQFHEPQGYELSFPLLQFKKTWEQFVDNLLHEWKVLNVISALLTSSTPLRRTQSCERQRCWHWCAR